MTDADDVLVPASTPRAAKRGSGCALTIVAFLAIVIAGLVVGRLLGPGDDDEDGKAATLEEGAIEDGDRERAWRIDAVIDEAGDSCVFFYEGDEAGSGGCGDSPQAATIADTTIVFGQVSTGDEEVLVELSDGSEVGAGTFTEDGFEPRYYIEIVPRAVEAVGLVP
jgi:hypothetical protein